MKGIPGNPAWPRGSHGFLSGVIGEGPWVFDKQRDAGDGDRGFWAKG